jgi:uncharacterized protein
MPTDQYHEPPEELGDDTRTFARVIASLQEEAEAIGWYEQRISIETDDQARRIMEHAQREEFLHFSMDLEFLARGKARRSGESRSRRSSSRTATSSTSPRPPRTKSRSSAGRLGGDRLLCDLGDVAAHVSCGLGVRVTER